MGVVGRGGALDMGSAPRDKLWIRPCEKLVLPSIFDTSLDDVKLAVLSGSAPGYFLSSVYVYGYGWGWC